MSWNSTVLSIACLLCLFLSGCGLMPHSGASRRQVEHAASSPSLDGIVVAKVDDKLARRLSAYKTPRDFSEVFGNSRTPSYSIGPGDVVEVAIWEPAPCLLFGSSAPSGEGQQSISAGASGSAILPPQMVMDDGSIRIPFVGRVRVSGRKLQDVEREIVRHLQGKANNPQVIVRLAETGSSQVSVLGDVAKSGNIILTPKKQRLLDALATVGGLVQSSNGIAPVTKVSLQLTRGNVTASMPLSRIIKDPKQNIPLLPGDVLTALFQPWTFSVLGAVGKNQEVPFEAQGISLAQALARVGGLNDNRADPGGVFVFRFEDASLVEPQRGKPAPVAVNGTVPVVYQVDFNDPGAFLVTQNFPMQDKDVVYVANMPSAELEKFLRMLGIVANPTLNLWYYNMRLAD